MYTHSHVCTVAWTHLFKLIYHLHGHTQVHTHPNAQVHTLKCMNTPTHICKQTGHIYAHLHTLTGLGRYSRMLVLIHVHTNSRPTPGKLHADKLGSLPASPGGRGVTTKPPEASGHRGACLRCCKPRVHRLTDQRHPLSPPRSTFPQPGAHAGTGGLGPAPPQSQPGHLLSRQTALSHRAATGAPREPSWPETRVPTGQRPGTHSHSHAHRVSHTVRHTYAQTHTHTQIHTHSQSHKYTHTQSHTLSDTHTLKHTLTHS